MKTFARYAPIGVAAGLLAACSTQGTVPQNSIGSYAPQWQKQHVARAVCPQVAGRPSCAALQVFKGGISPLCSPSSCGWTPAQLEAAYGLTGSIGKGSGTNVAVIEAGDLTNASSDLATYRSEYGLGTANLTKYNEYGQQSNYPPSCQNYGWCVEGDLDIEMLSAACPKCNIILVEARDYGISDFETAEAEAVKLGATIVSNSWSCFSSYDCGDPNFPKYFEAPGVAYLGSSGNGYGEIGAPAVLATVVAVGGTQLEHSGKKYTESIWDDAGGGCASPSEVGGKGVKKPSWQHDPDCKYRTVGDVSAEAGCSPGVAVYISLYGGWTDVCGTAVSTPFTAGVIGLAGNADKIHGGKTFWMLNGTEHKNYFHHPASGVDGNCGNYICGDGRYEKYYSGPGGWGTPNGIKGY
jgi:subtilase family serine protease